MKDNPGTVCYRITHRRSVRQIATDIRLRPEMWDEKLQRPVPSVGDMDMRHARIEGDLAVLRTIIGTLDRAGTPYTASEVIRRFRSPEYNMSVFTFMRSQIVDLRRCNRLGTASNYERALQSFARFLGGDIPLAALSGELIDSYNAYLARRGIRRNSVSFYMRILRAVYNKAVRKRLAEPSNPFRQVYTGIDKTRKRFIDEKMIVCLYNLALPSDTPLALTRDLFIFSYCTRGMAFVNMAYLRKTDIQDSFIRYARRKTGQVLSVRIEPCIRTIIGRYREKTGNSPYLFPLLTATDPEAAYA